MSIELKNVDNRTYFPNANLAYCDMMYENRDLDWLPNILGIKNVIIIQTDYHSSADVMMFMRKTDWIFLNEIIYINDWGGVPKKAFPRKHDNIFIYVKEYKWYPDRIRIEKRTKGSAFDVLGKDKVPCDVFYDHVSFSTVAKERIKIDNKCFQYQKPAWLYDRIILPFIDKEDTVYDPFMGVGTLGLWCKKFGCNYVGIERDEKTFKVAEKVINN